jgi:hypothetical protein
MKVWIKIADWNLFVNGMIIEGIKDAFNSTFDKTPMKSILISPIEVEAETDATVSIRKKY